MTWWQGEDDCSPHGGSYDEEDVEVGVDGSSGGDNLDQACRDGHTYLPLCSSLS